MREQKRITEIPAPPCAEKLRGEYILKRFLELGRRDRRQRRHVIALRKGSGGTPKLVISAHQDTVFAEGTDVTVKEQDGRILAPGIGDDARGLAALISLMQSLNDNAITTVGDILFVATVGEEELGNLRGVKALFRDHKDIDGFISIDGLGITHVVNQSTGSHRYEMIFKGPGGHSFQEFGLPSAIHALGRAIAKISDLQTPSDPKTTFTVGTVSGGTSVNAIASEARMSVDMRSNSTEELLKLEERLLGLVKIRCRGKQALEFGQAHRRDQADRRPPRRDRRAGLAHRAGDTARRDCSHTRSTRNLCRLQHRFQSRHVARHSRGDHRRRRRRRKLAFAQRMVQTDRCVFRAAERPAHHAGTIRRRRRDQADAADAALVHSDLCWIIPGEWSQRLILGSHALGGALAPQRAASRRMTAIPCAVSALRDASRSLSSGAHWRDPLAILLSMRPIFLPGLSGVFFTPTCTRRYFSSPTISTSPSPKHKTLSRNATPAY